MSCNHSVLLLKGDLTVDSFLAKTEALGEDHVVSDERVEAVGAAIAL